MQINRLSKLFSHEIKSNIDFWLHSFAYSFARAHTHTNTHMHMHTNLYIHILSQLIHDLISSVSFGQLIHIIHINSCKTIKSMLINLKYTHSPSHQSHTRSLAHSLVHSHKSTTTHTHASIKHEWRSINHPNSKFVNDINKFTY